jgi:hypothetical protein
MTKSTCCQQAPSTSRVIYEVDSLIDKVMRDETFFAGLGKRVRRPSRRAMDALRDNFLQEPKRKKPSERVGKENDASKVQLRLSS